MDKPTYEQLERQIKLLELSNNALQFQVRSAKDLAARRLVRNKNMKFQLDKAKELLAKVQYDEVET